MTPSNKSHFQNKDESQLCRMKLNLFNSKYNCCILFINEENLVQKINLPMVRMLKVK